MALQIIENNMEEKELVMVGIKDRGVDIAKRLQAEIQQITAVDIVLIELNIDKKNPLVVDMPQEIVFENKCIIMVDDVADSGKTMLYAIKPFLRCMVKKIEVAVLIDREHKRFPIISNYIGYQVSTTLKDNIRVEVSKESITAYLV
jgi:pyrimidine operon attenuation protein/uracil phosphoribosyltransferase